MPRIEKTVFLSYRRTNLAWALNIYQNLTQHEYDVFIDFEGIGPGDFEQVITENINSRAHFVVILTPSSLERCNEPGDWLRREIETALEMKRNIVPILFEGFDFDTPKIADQLTGKLVALKHFQGLTIPPTYFMEAMVRLRDRWLSVPLSSILYPASLPARQAATEQKVSADAQPAVREDELSAQQWFERGYVATDSEDELRCNNEAIRLKPDYAEAFYNRGVAFHEKGNLGAALKDYTEAIRLNPNDADSFYNRGIARDADGDTDGALRDYDEVIRLKPDYAEAFYNRSIARDVKGDFDGAMKDYDAAIRLRPDFAEAEALAES